MQRRSPRPPWLKKLACSVPQDARRFLAPAPHPQNGCRMQTLLGPKVAELRQGGGYRRAGKLRRRMRRLRRGGHPANECIASSVSLSAVVLLEAFGNRITCTLGSS